MIETGRVLAVNASPLGDELTAGAAVGATTLTVSDAVDFNESGGYLYYADAEVIAYVSADDDTGVITLAAPTTVEGFEGDTVQVWDNSEGAVAVEMVAHISLEGEDQDSDAMEAVVPHTLIPYLPEGIRSGETEFVSLEWQGAELIVRDVLYKEPMLDAAYIPPPDKVGNAVYRGDTPPWGDGDSSHASDDGDIWYDTSVITNEDNTTTQGFHPYLWDGVGLKWVDARDPDLDLISGTVTNNEQALSDLSTTVENVSETATDARNLASTADGRVSFSDYDPAPDDVTYYATDGNGNLVLDTNGDPILLTRNPGSVWYTRTRARQNLCANPSFETDTSLWRGTYSTISRVTANTAISGTYALQVTNDATGSNFRVEYDAFGGFDVQPGQTFSSTAFTLLGTGSGVGAFAYAYFTDSVGGFVSEVYGDPLDLDTADWRELKLTVTVPDNAAKMFVQWFNPNASDVWLIDGVLVEQAEYTGRYFDGDSYDGSWDGTPDLSTSSLAGGKIVSVFELYDSGWVRLDFTGSTAYDADAGDLTKGTLDPERIADHSIGVEKQKTNVVKASEALSPGDIVNVWDNNGLFFVRKASASNNYEAHGFVIESAVTGDEVHVHTSGYNPFFADLTPGAQFLSSTAGEVTAWPPAQAGYTVQRVGFASDTTTLHFTASQPIRLT